jgi:phospholipid/cholesterol/gamma-HCH transport system permease protein
MKTNRTETMENTHFQNPSRAELNLSQPTQDALLISFSGSWKMGNALPPEERVISKMEASSTIRRIAFDTQNLTGWDSGLLTFLIKVIDQCSQRTLLVDKTGLPHGVQRLLALASAVPERAGARKETTQEPFLSRVGTATI